jgi:hypothetical protein
MPLERLHGRDDDHGVTAIGGELRQTRHRSGRSSLALSQRHDRAAEVSPADLKWLTMGDASAFGDAGTFTGHPWKMHLELRADGDGTAMKLIWRINGGDDDHMTINPPSKTGGPDWKTTDVYHFIFAWTPSSYSISINGAVWFSGSLQGAYVPPNFRVSLGCYPRSETLAGAIFRNVKIGPQ